MTDPITIKIHRKNVWDLAEFSPGTLDIELKPELAEWLNTVAPNQWQWCWWWNSNYKGDAFSGEGYLVIPRELESWFRIKCPLG
jgi:hypothetical protein